VKVVNILAIGGRQRVIIFSLFNPIGCHEDKGILYGIGVLSGGGPTTKIKYKPCQLHKEIVSNISRMSSLLLEPFDGEIIPYPSCAKQTLSLFYTDYIV
jgi:hypothetical protein